MKAESNPSPENLLVDARSAAKMLGICPRKLWSLTNSRAISHVRIGRSVRYSKEALRRWIEDNCIGGAA